MSATPELNLPAITAHCRDCAWTVTQPTALRAGDFAAAHADRHGHEWGFGR